jgi:hemerythrin
MLQWDESYSVRVRDIDEQHKGWFDAVNRFRAAVDSREAAQEFAKLLEFLIDYAELHFKTEEKYFDKFGYEGAESHKHQHRAFIEIVEGYKARFEADEPIVAEEVSAFLNRWLEEHILSSDMRYVACFRENGLS